MQTMMSSVLGTGQNVDGSKVDVSQFCRFLRKKDQVFLSIFTPRENQELIRLSLNYLQVKKTKQNKKLVADYRIIKT